MNVHLLIFLGIAYIALVTWIGRPEQPVVGPDRNSNDDTFSSHSGGRY